MAALDAGCARSTSRTGRVRTSQGRASYENCLHTPVCLSLFASFLFFFSRLFFSSHLTSSSSPSSSLQLNTINYDLHLRCVKTYYDLNHYLRIEYFQHSLTVQRTLRKWATSVRVNLREWFCSRGSRNC